MILNVAKVWKCRIYPSILYMIFKIFEISCFSPR
jgi:hypothetical protein